MNKTEAIQILVQAVLIGQRSGIYKIGDARQIANAIDVLEQAEKAETVSPDKQTAPITKKKK